MKKELSIYKVDWHILKGLASLLYYSILADYNHPTLSKPLKAAADGTRPSDYNTTFSNCV